MTRRISRAKQRIRDSGIPFALPGRRARPTARRGAPRALPDLQRGLRQHLRAEPAPPGAVGRGHPAGPHGPPAAALDDGEVTGLLALMLLTDARRPARTGPDGELGPGRAGPEPLGRRPHRRGGGPITDALPRGPTGPYQLQAAIAAVHDEAPSAEATDWPQIVALYELLRRLSDNPVVALNHAVAVAMARGPRAGLDLLGELEADERIADDHRLHAVCAHLLELAGDRAGARDAYLAAARRTTNLPQQRYLHGRAARLPAAARGPGPANRSRAAASRSARTAQAAAVGVDLDLAVVVVADVQDQLQPARGGRRPPGRPTRRTPPRRPRGRPPGPGPPAPGGR